VCSCVRDTPLGASPSHVLQWPRRPLAQALLVFSSAPLAPNAPGELLPEAGATQERTLEAVRSTGLFGKALCCA
jgi:hypothetical protein